FIETPLNEKVRATNPELVKTFIDHTPLGRTGKPEDIVGPAIFLACDLSAYVTGSIIMADGGYRSILPPFKAPSPGRLGRKRAGHLGIRAGCSRPECGDRDERQSRSRPPLILRAPVR